MSLFPRALHGSRFWLCTDGYGFQEPRVQMFCGYGFHIIAVGAWMVPEKLGLLRSGLRSLVKSSVWLRCGLRFQVKSAGRFRSGLQSQHISSRTATSSMPSTLGMHSPLRTNSCIFLHPPSPHQPPLVPIHILEALAASFLLRSNDGVVLLNLR